MKSKGRRSKRRGGLSRGGGPVNLAHHGGCDRGFYGTGTASTSSDDRANYSFRQTYASASWTSGRRGTGCFSAAGPSTRQWEQRPGEGSAPSVEEVYTPETLPGLEAKITYLHWHGTAAIDWRTSAGYSRRGGYYGAAFHGYADGDDTYSFRQVDYEAVQHVPLFRDAWVLSLHARVQTTYTDDDQVIPFFMLPAVGGGSSLRGFTSWRFRDRHALLLQVLN